MAPCFLAVLNGTLISGHLRVQICANFGIFFSIFQISSWQYPVFFFKKILVGITNSPRPAAPARDFVVTGVSIFLSAATNRHPR